MHHIHSKNIISYYLSIALLISFLIGSFFVNLFSILISIYTFYWMLNNRNYSILIEKPFIFLSLLFCLFLTSSIFSDYKFSSFENSIGFLLNFFLFIALVLIIFDDDRKLFQISKLVFLIVIFICFDLWLQKYIGKNILGFPSQQAGRLTSIFKDEQIPGGVLFRLSPFIIYYLFKEKKINFIIKFKYFIIIFIYLSILITGERAPSILSTLLMLSLVIANFKSINKKELKKITSLLILILIVLLSQKNSIIKERIYFTIFQQSKNNVYIKFYKNSFEIFKKNFILGSGLQTYRYECPKISETCSSHPHNFLVELFTDSGMFAPILFFISLLSLILNKTKKINDRFFKSMVVIYTILFFFPLIPTGSFFTSFHMTITWFSLGFLYSIKKIN